MKKIQLNGPVFPVVTPFIADTFENYPIDYPGLKRYVDYLLDQGAKNIMVASATSRFAQLNEHEIESINNTVVNQVDGRGIAIASTGIQGSTAQHVATAQHAESIGADIIACEYPWRFQSSKGLLDYFKAIVHGTTSINIMLHVTPGRSELGGTYRYDLESLREICSLPRVIAMKEASGDQNHSKAIWEELSGRTSIIVAGKASQTFYDAYDFGVSGYFVGIGNIMPKIDMEIYALMNTGNRSKAKMLIDSYEAPFLSVAKPFGWHAALKAALAHAGLMSITERPPMHPLTLEQQKTLADILHSFGWTDHTTPGLHTIEKQMHVA